MTSNEIQVRQATVADIDALVPLFDGYRQFYGRSSDLTLARTFLLARFEHQESVIFLANSSTNQAVGFTQLYPSFSSVSAARTFILNDLFVVQEARKCGVGAKLLKASANYGRSKGAVRLTLSTATNNETAQALYERNGWVRDETYCVFNLGLDT